METTSVTSKGQVTIPKSVRQKLGIRQGSRIEFVVSGSQATMRVASTPVTEVPSGFGLLKSKRKPVPVDADPAQWARRP
jgi:AbrB family looped-hinge helix DNA binding protein